VQYGLLDDGTFTTFGQVCNQTEVNISGLIPGEEYCFQVLSVCANGEISAPRRICVALSNIACGCPTNVTANSGTNSIALSWNAVSGATGYRVEYRQTGTATFTTVNVTGTSTTITGLNCVSYDVRVSSVCGGQVSSGCGLIVAQGCGVPAGPAQFQLAIGRTALEEGYEVQSTTDGGYIITGYTSNAGNRDAYLAKLSACGDIEWERTYGGNFDDESRAVAVLPNGGYAIAGFSSSFGNETYSAYLLNINANGTINWERKYGGTDARRFYDVQVTSDGGFILTGDALKAAGSTDRDLLLMKVSGAGNVEWVRTFGGVSEDIGYQTIEVSDGFVTAGFTSSFGTGGDVYVVKTAKSNGATLWQRNYGGSQRDEGYSIVEDAGNLVVAGSTRSFGTGSADAYIVKINGSNGNVIWANAYGGTSFDIAYFVNTNTAGSYVVAGSTQSAGNGNQAFLLAANPNNGAVQWGVAYGGTGSDLARSYIQTSDGGYAVFGTTRSFGENASAAPNFYLIKTGLQGTTGGCNSSNLTWNASNAAGTQVGTPTIVATTPVNNLIAGTTTVASVSLTRTVVCQVINCGATAPCNLTVSVSGSTTICPGGSATLSANVSGAANVTLTWAGPNGFTATGSSITVSPTTTSTYTVTANAPGCSPQSATGTVTIGELTVSASATSAPNATITVNVSGGIAPYTVRLILNGITIATNNNVATSTTFNNVASGTYTVGATSANGCTGSTTVTVTAGTGCSTPTGLAVSTTGVASWNAVSGATSYEVRYGITGTSTSTWTTLTAFGTSIQLTGLQQGSTYEVQVRTICAGGQTSAFSQSVLFN
ncbi:MAG: fibronectin type III domain-containing protein, partial [Bacteroidia bacterium]|nr:fibronectin type III domain-containing protein [Bacteroidia bacterium]